MPSKSPPPDIVVTTVPPGPRVPSGIDRLTERVEPSDDEIMAHADPVQRLLYKRINEFSDSVLAPDGRISQLLGSADKIDKQLPLLSRQIGNLQLQVSTLVSDQRQRNHDDESNWKLIRTQVSGIRTEMQMLKEEISLRIAMLAQEQEKLVIAELEIRAEVKALWSKLQELSPPKDD